MDNAGKARGRPPLTTEDEILDAALKAFAELGYEGTSVRTLNRELGMSHNTIRQRFGSKEELWYRAADHGFGAFVAELDADAAAQADQSDDHMVMLEQWLYRFVRLSVDHPLLLRLMNHEAIQPSQRLEYIFQTYMHPKLKPLEEHLSHLRADGRLRPVTLRTLFLMLAHGAGAPYTLVGLSGQFDEFDGPFDPTTHAELATAVLVHGIQTH